MSRVRGGGAGATPDEDAAPRGGPGGGVDGERGGPSPIRAVGFLVALVLSLGGGIAIGGAMLANTTEDPMPGMSMGAAPMGGMGGDRAMSPGAMGANALTPETFVEEMIPHHLAAVSMAEAILPRTRHPEVRRLAREIVADQLREIDELRRWYRETMGTDFPVATDGMDDLREITAGDEPDRAFLRMMIPHHARAITMADQVLLGGPDARVGSIARNIVAAQAAEIGEMQRWRARWFPPQG